MLGNRALVDVSGNGTEVLALRLMAQGDNIDEYIPERKALLAEDLRTLPLRLPLSAGSEVDLIREMRQDPSLRFPNLEGPRTSE